MEYKLGYDSWGDGERDAIQRVVDSGRYTMGPETEAFEEEFAKYVGSKYAVMVNSGSSANLVIISALVQNDDLKPGDEVIVPMLSWPTMYYPLWQHGLVPVFLDIDMATLTLDTAKLSLEGVLSEKTRAVLIPNILGNPADYNSIITFCWENDLLLIEDNCEGLGSEYVTAYDTKKVGNIGVAGSYSFFFSHHLQTMEGGMITTNDSGLYNMMKSIRSHGWTRGTEWDTGAAFDFIYLGYNVRPVEMSAAIGRVQLERFDKFLSARHKNAALFLSLTNGLLGVRSQVTSIDGLSSWFGFSLLFENEDVKGVVQDALETSGVETRPIISGNFLNHVVMGQHADPNDHRNLKYRIVSEKNVEDTVASLVENRGLMIGNSGYNLEDQITHAYDVMRKVVNDE